MQPKIEKPYQFSIINENLEPKEQETSDPAFYNVYEFFNGDHDKYDDYQNYGDEISDRTIGKIDINFINPSIPLAEPQFKFTCDRCHNPFYSRNRFFPHLRLNCWKFNINEKFLHEKTIAMVTNETLTDVTSLPVIVFSITVVENTGYTFKNWHNAVLHMHWEIDCFKPTDICANNGCTMFIIDRIYFQVLPIWKNVKIKRITFKIPIRGIGI